jgi:hypothetical protein
MTDADPRVLSDEATVPIPPRYWWLKRILLAVGVLILALVVLRLWWGWEAERRLQAKIAEYHAAGQPVTIDDFQSPPVPDKENAAKYLQDAAAAIVTPEDVRLDFGDICDDLELVEEYAGDVARLVEASGEALRLARQARSMPRADWKIGLKSPVVSTLLPQFSPQHHLAQFLSTAALYQHLVGDDAVTIETLGDMQAQVRRVEDMGFLISELVAIGIDGLAIEAIEEITPTLRIDLNSVDGTSHTLWAPEEQVRALIAALLDDEPLREGWRNGMYSERLEYLDTAHLFGSSQVNIGAITGGPWIPRPLAVALRPMFISDGVFMMEYATAYAEAGSEARYASDRELMPRYPSFESALQRNMHFLSRQLLPTLDRALEIHFAGITRRHMAATALAVRLYELKNGQRPTSLDQLVPDCLAELPVDPFAGGGQPLGYRPDASPPVVYSVGADGVDDAGQWELAPSGGVSRDSKDLVFFLNGDRPRVRPTSLATQPTTEQAMEENRDDVGHGGQSDEDSPGDDDP